jgi:general secretion pathway protein K
VPGLQTGGKTLNGLLSVNTAISFHVGAKLRDVQTAMRDTSSGFTLVVVLWVFGLLAAMVAGFALSTRTTIQVAANLSENARAEALADGGVELAFLDLLRTAEDGTHRVRFEPNGVNVSCNVSDVGTLRIAVRDEAGLIDINRAGIPLLEALFAGTGNQNKASTLASAIFDYRDPDSVPRAEGGEDDAYLASGLNWKPKNSSFISKRELSRVLGVTDEILDRAAPYITVHSEQAGIDPNFSEPKLLSILRTGVEGRALSLSTFPELDPKHGLPGIFFAPSQKRVFTVMADAHLTSGARFIREATVDIGSRRSRKLTIIRWLRRTHHEGEPSQPPLDLPPPC